MFQIPDWAFEFHGHRCPAMPMGLRVGAAAMNALGVDRAKDGQIQAFVCEVCGEMTVMEYGRVKGDKKVCIDCASK